jgi:sugar phosphate isomerase/epimerase
MTTASGCAGGVCEDGAFGTGGFTLEKTPLDTAEFGAEDTRSVETFQPQHGESRLQIGVFNDGLSHLSREQAFAWCAERGIARIEMGVGGWAQAPHQLDLDALLREPAARDRLGGELRGHGLEISCVNAAGNPLHPLPAIGDRHAALVRGAIELAHAMGVARVVTMSGCPGSRDGGQTPVFAPWALTPDDESLWEWQLEHRLAPFWHELCGWAAAEAPEVRICLELHPGASAYSSASFLRLAEHAGPNLGVNFDPSHFWWQGIDPACVIEDVGDRIGFAHGKDTLIHPDRVRRHGLIDFRFPVEPDVAVWHFAAVGTGRGVERWAELLAALRAAGYDGDVSIEHEDPRMGAEEGIETSLAALRAALALAEVPVG